MERTTTYVYEKVERKKKVKVVCNVCGRIKQTIVSVSQTINPFNKNSDGELKTRDEISEELGRELIIRCTNAVGEGYTCNPCLYPKKEQTVTSQKGNQILSELCLIYSEIEKHTKEYKEKTATLHSRHSELVKELKGAKIKIIYDFYPYYRNGKNYKGKAYLIEDLYIRSTLPYIEDYWKSGISLQVDSWKEGLEIKHIECI